MSNRSEFTTKTKVMAFERCNGKCENCTAKIRFGAEYDHIVPAALGGSNDLNNAKVLCKTCHKFKTSSEDVPRIAKAKRVKAGHLNAKDKRRGFRTPPAGYDPWTRRMRAES